MSEHVLVIGAGIGGLCAALSLQPTGRQITLLERDLAPPSTDPDVTFLDWHRRGAGHMAVRTSNPCAKTSLAKT